MISRARLKISNLGIEFNSPGAGLGLFLIGRKWRASNFPALATKFVGKAGEANSVVSAVGLFLHVWLMADDPILLISAFVIFLELSNLAMFKAGSSTEKKESSY